jgi:hypothetical protein
MGERDQGEMSLSLSEWERGWPHRKRQKRTLLGPGDRRKVSVAQILEWAVTVRGHGEESSECFCILSVIQEARSTAKGRTG